MPRGQPNAEYKAPAKLNLTRGITVDLSELRRFVNIRNLERGIVTQPRDRSKGLYTLAFLVALHGYFPCFRDIVGGLADCDVDGGHSVLSESSCLVRRDNADCAEAFYGGEGFAEDVRLAHGTGTGLDVKVS